MEKKPKQKKGSPVALVWLVILAVGLISNLSDNLDLDELFFRLRIWFIRHGMSPSLMIPLLFTVVIVILILVIVAVAKSRAGTRADKPAAPARRRDPRTESFTQPEAHCVSCELSGEDHFARDRAQRIRQLDDWLKNGIIDRAEYNQLKQRYQRDV